jgi:hypothetical protein
LHVTSLRCSGNELPLGFLVPTRERWNEGRVSKTCEKHGKSAHKFTPFNPQNAPFGHLGRRLAEFY